MLFKVISLFVLIAVVQVLSLPNPSRQARDVAPEKDESLDKLANMFNEFKDGVSSLIKNISQTDAFKQVQKFGEEVNVKGKELGNKIQETINNMKN